MIIALALVFSIADLGVSQILGYRGGSTLAHCTGSDVAGRPADVPWIDASQSGTDINVRGDGEGWNKWHFRWANGGPEKAYEYGGDQRSFTLRGIAACQRVTLKIQGCVKHLVGHDRCSPFETTTFIAAPSRAYGPDTCAQGYVWRGAFPDDDVCVAPAVRDQTAGRQCAASGCPLQRAAGSPSHPGQ